VALAWCDAAHESTASTYVPRRSVLGRVRANFTNTATVHLVSSRMLRSPAVRIAGMRIDPDGTWMMQIARNVFDPECLDQFILGNGTFATYSTNLSCTI
jgi:hypothetical protein